jgi:hypothetical protein
MDSQYRYRIIETNDRYRIIEHKWKQTKWKRIDQVELNAFGERIHITPTEHFGGICIYKVISEIYETEASNF